jgi:hypothetical protein
MVKIFNQNEKNFNHVINKRMKLLEKVFGKDEREGCFELFNSPLYNFFSPNVSSLEDINETEFHFFTERYTSFMAEFSTMDIQKTKLIECLYVIVGTYRNHYIAEISEILSGIQLQQDSGDIEDIVNTHFTTIWLPRLNEEGLLHRKPSSHQFTTLLEFYLQQRRAINRSIPMNRFFSASNKLLDIYIHGIHSREYYIYYNKESIIHYIGDQDLNWVHAALQRRVPDNAVFGVIDAGSVFTANMIEKKWVPQVEGNMTFLDVVSVLQGLKMVYSRVQPMVLHEKSKEFLLNFLHSNPILRSRLVRGIKTMIHSPLSLNVNASAVAICSIAKLNWLKTVICNVNVIRLMFNKEATEEREEMNDEILHAAHTNRVPVNDHIFADMIGYVMLSLLLLNISVMLTKSIYNRVKVNRYRNQKFNKIISGDAEKERKMIMAYVGNDGVEDVLRSIDGRVRQFTTMDDYYDN